MSATIRYSDRCTKCGQWFTFDNVADLKNATKEHKAMHKKQEKEDKKREKGGLKDQVCTKCGKKFLGSKKGLCTKCFEKKMKGR